jgi:hypothetical protein
MGRTIWRFVGLVVAIEALMIATFTATDLPSSFFLANADSSNIIVAKPRAHSRPTKSAFNLIERHVNASGASANMLSVPEHAYLKDQNAAATIECPLHFYVYRNEDIHPDFTTKNEQAGLDSFASGSEENFNLEIYLIRLFRTSPCRVYEHTLADVFVVPYLHATHCLLSDGYEMNCKHVPQWQIDTVISNLTYFSPSNHVFLLGWGTYVSNFKLQRMPLTLTVGPAIVKSESRKRGKTIMNAPTATVVPMVNGHARFQVEDRASILAAAKNRTYALAYFYGAGNLKMKGKKNYRRFRKYFGDEFQDGEHLGGKSVLVKQLTDGVEVKYEDFYQAYEDSIFCPVMAGDASWQQRFYDAMLCGCLPVVLEWDTTHPGGRSWHVPNNGASVWETYPFPKGKFGGDAALEIDYDSFVVRVPGNTTNESDMSAVRTTLERMLIHELDAVLKMQQSLRQNIQFLVYNLGLRAHTTEDAFYRTLKVLARNARSLTE